MDMFSFKKDKALTLMTIIFLVWIGFLLILGITNTREVVFFDVISQTDVSSNYLSVIPLERYLLEPIIGVTLLFPSIVDGILAIFVIYGIGRVAYIILEKKFFLQSEKFKLLTNLTRKYTKFVFWLGILIILSIVTSILIGYSSEGFLFLNNFWQVSVQTYLTIALIAMAIVLVYFLGKLIHPRLKFNYKPHPYRKSIVGTTFHRIGRELKYLITFLFIVITIAILLIGTHFPTQRIETTIPLGPNEYLFDFHVHTTMSDGFLSPEERVDWYIAQGIHGAAFTDHENQRGAFRARQYVEQNNLNFTVIIGQEYTTTYGIHLNIFGMNQTIVPIEYADEWPGGPLSLNTSDMIQYVKAQGGFVIVNHYTTDGNGPYTYNQLQTWGVDGFEIANAGREYPTQIRTFCEANGLACIAGSDVHTNQEIHTITKVTLTDLNNLTDIFATLKLNTHEAVIIDLYPEKVNLPEIQDLSQPFEDVLNYFLNLDFFQILSWIIWSAGGYLLFFAAYKLIKRADLQKLQEKVLK